MTETFVRDATRIETDGLLKRYMVRYYEGNPRGRISLEHSLRRHWARGHRHKLSSAASALTCDLPENQLLLAAARRLLGLLAVLAPEARSEILTSLAHFATLLERAGVDEPKELTDVIVSADQCSPAYERAIALAKAILAGKAVAIPEDGDEIMLASIVVDMETLFERYVRALLIRDLNEYSVLDGNRTGAKPFFDDRPSPRAQPDIVVKTGNTAVLIGEVKYKPHYSREDLNQILTYASSFRCRRVVLMLPSISQDERICETVGTLDSSVVYLARLEIGEGDIARSENRFTAAVRGILNE
jgi:5-methylcytosine-specific restriction enzyme subunit McrC